MTAIAARISEFWSMADSMLGSGVVGSYKQKKARSGNAEASLFAGKPVATPLPGAWQTGSYAPMRMLYVRT
ncbi:hypothetical protein [Cupriavidus pinatubonensis]|jgi:hypothetical protein|uniref:hypothetical protein n=1 Tax=Cupriavidus pinatubonensis TaxID=248026 RepID=UPI001CC54BCC|nr:hypothetical protein [Cupriavidus pinatubonensis]